MFLPLDEWSIDQTHYYMHVFHNRRNHVYKGLQYMFNRLCLFGKISANDAHRAIGNISGYPKCCIDNFIKLAERGVPAAKYMDKTYGNTDNCGYVKCLKCR